MESIKNIITMPWPWYVSGPLLGLIVPLLLLLTNKQFGVSSSFRHICASTGLKVKGYFSYDWKKQGAWQLFFVLGLFLAGLLVALIDGFEASQLSEKAIKTFSQKDIAFQGWFPKDLFFGWNSWIIILGGVFIGFGSRYAGGCTGGHAIMGMSLFAKSSLLAVSGFFAGGILGTYLLIEILL